MSRPLGLAYSENEALAWARVFRDYVAKAIAVQEEWRVEGILRNANQALSFALHHADRAQQIRERRLAVYE